MSVPTVPQTADRDHRPDFSEITDLLADKLRDLAARYYDIPISQRHIVNQAIAETADTIRPALDILRAMDVLQAEGLTIR